MTDPACCAHCQGEAQDAERDPEATIRRHADASREQLLALLGNDEYWAHLVELAVERASGIGVDEYGTGAWDKTPAGLLGEAGQELADAIFYLGVRREVSA